MKKRVAVVLAILVAAAIAVFLIFSSRDGQGPQQLTKVRMVDGLTINSIHAMLASKLGYFADEGLDVDLSYTAIGKLAMDQFTAGSVEYAGVVEMNVAQALFKDDDISILCEFAEPVTGIKVLGRTDKGVQTGADLRGKKIAVFFGVNIHIFIQKYLAEQGISLDQVELVNLSPPDAAAAFISGAVDAIVTWEPIIFNVRQKVGDLTVLLTEDSQRYWTYKLILVTRRSRLAGHEDEANRVLRAMIRADRFISEKPQEAYAMVAQHLQLDPSVVAGFCEEIDYEIRITPRLLGMIEFETEWLPQYLPTFYSGKKPVTSDFAALVADNLKTLVPAAYQLKK